MFVLASFYIPPQFCTSEAEKQLTELITDVKKIQNILFHPCPLGILVAKISPMNHQNTNSK